MRTHFTVTDREIVRSRVEGTALLEAKIREMGPYAHDFGDPVRNHISSGWRVSFEAPADPSWCL